jgi:GNAT superfamily N-acetyltransferase
MPEQNWATFLPGRLTVARGSPRDYFALERFHYVPKRPATWAGVWVVSYQDDDDAAPSRAKLVAIAVVSYPTVNCAARDAALELNRLTRARKLAWVNRNVRTISRVVVHPQFRGVGIAARLVRHVCDQCPTRWVEALAAMGRVHPFFERGGMRRAGEGRAGVIYYVHEKGGEILNAEC